MDAVVKKRQMHIFSISEAVDAASLTAAKPVMVEGEGVVYDSRAHGG